MPPRKAAARSPENGTERRPTLLDVARRAGVSRATASLVIRDAPGPSAQSRERVRAAAAELGYRPDVTAQLLRRRQSQLIGVVFSAQDPFHADLIEHIYAAAEDVGYDVVLSAVVATRDERRAFEALVASRCAAVVALGVREDCRTDHDSQLPVVEIGRPSNETSFDAVHTADEEGTHLAVEHLVSLGHQDIVHIDGGDQPGAVERRAGYVDAMRSHGLQHQARVLPGDYTELSGIAAARTLLEDNELPTAVIAGNDQCAVGLLDELRRSGIDVPGQISIVGYDDSRLARLAHVNLTTVRQDAEQLARLAVQTALDRLDNGLDSQPRVCRLAPHLVVRSTTGPARRRTH
ncbi:LacI family transcriptional regulator [Saccharopolyspora subtropica]|uniref:LacI family DNA-binding transcriptional regulator n=1 Tax=Saccharopolyspora thermophila TaxID=89367 RepID=A0A917JX75_9PSEU|nr:LacI family DNA-binding transcriptional regulator [Saccharopolyspora subtropica]GGI87166.1 LacI family transcriptional regulator [Saccharopolyspora subtropica]